MLRITIYLILLLKVVSNGGIAAAFLQTIPIGTPPMSTKISIITTTIPTIITTKWVQTTTLAKPLTTSLPFSTIKTTIKTTTKITTTTFNATTTTIKPIFLSYSGFLLVESAEFADVEANDVTAWIEENGVSIGELDIVDKKLINQDAAKSKRRKRSTSKNLAVRFIGQSKEDLTNLSDKINSEINNKKVLKSKIWVTGGSSCEAVKCTESVCQVNVQGEFYCESCMSLRVQSKFDNNNVTWTTNDTKVLNEFYCPVSYKLPQPFKPQLLALIAIPCILALIILIAVLFFCCKKRKSRSKQNLELDQIHPAQYDNNDVRSVVSSEYINAQKSKSDDKEYENEVRIPEKADDFGSKSDTFRYSYGSDIMNNKGSVRGLY